MSNPAMTTVARVADDRTGPEATNTEPIARSKEDARAAVIGGSSDPLVARRAEHLEIVRKEVIDAAGGIELRHEEYRAALLIACEACAHGFLAVVECRKAIGSTRDADAVDRLCRFIRQDHRLVVGD